ncbi:MAG TPA: TetR/AcrR family transcriptional regulator [Candidatus Saccharimonadales bacterium]|nr:TetR/AcrR family transcriptional regulator [Candidatus Saccharimonadales bacterium]
MPVPARPEGSGVAPARAAAARRRARQQEIVTSTRRLFDARGSREANIDDIARAVGINRAIIYRHFASKEELFALTLAEYLTELDGRLSEVDDPQATPRQRFTAVSREFAGYCLQYPAFVDCALALLGRPGPTLLEEISDAALLRLGGLMGIQLHRIAGILRLDRSAAGGDRRCDGDPLGQGDVDVLANALYLQVLGVMHLARSGVVLRPAAGGQANWAMVGPDRIVDLVTGMAVAVAFPGR